MCSSRELFSGSPLRVSLIEVIYAALVLTASSLRSLWRAASLPVHQWHLQLVYVV
ncbi:MAG: hypothetical protein M3264_13185 [Thermoproteota archaeon]|nr:hypothetical protein [Thermoproteota archaeon]